MDCPSIRRSPPLGEEEQQRHLSVRMISPPVRLDSRSTSLGPGWHWRRVIRVKACLRFIKATAGLEKEA